MQIDDKRQQTLPLDRPPMELTGIFGCRVLAILLLIPTMNKKILCKISSSLGPFCNRFSMAKLLVLLICQWLSYMIFVGMEV